MVSQLTWLFVLAIPIACVAWTVTHEEIFKEPRDYCLKRSQACKTLLIRKFFYLFTCEYCFSHWVALFFVAFTSYRLLLDDWRGYIIAGFALVWVANMYMSFYGLLRMLLKEKKNEAKSAEIEVHKLEEEMEDQATAY